jgi:Flp pilus assembly protein TadG
MKKIAGWIRTRLARGCRNERGAAAVELALVMPILILLLFGIIEFARVWNVRQTMTDAAREGARVAVVNVGLVKPATALQDSVIKIVTNAASAAGMDLAMLTVSHTGIGSGDFASVRLAYVYKPLMGLVLPGPITLNTSSVMRNE